MVTLEANSYARVIRECGYTKDLATGKRTHAEIVREGYAGDRYLGNLLVQMYGKCGDMHEARKVFNEIHQRNVFSWTIMFTAYAQNGQGKEAVQLYREMDSQGVALDSVMFVSVLKACSVAEDLSEGRAVHARTRSLGYESDSFVATALVSMYGKCGSVEEAEEVFWKMEEKHPVSWNAMLAAYAQNGQPMEAVRIYRVMCWEGVRPDSATFVSLLDALCHVHRDEIEKLGKEVHGYVSEAGLGTDSAVANALVSMYGAAGNMNSLREVFEGISSKTVISWNAMLTAYLQSNCFHEAVSLFWKMDVPRNAVSFVCVLRACLILEEGRSVHELAKASGLDSEVTVSTTLINMYGAFGRVDEATSCFDKVESRDRVCWNAMLGAYAQNGHASETLDLFEEMKQAKLKPDTVSFVNVLGACGSSGLLAEGRKIHSEVLGSDINPSCALGGALINMYSECGDVESAMNVFKEFRQLAVTLWDALAAAFAHNNMVSAAFYLFTRICLEGFRVNEFTLISILDSCSRVKALREGSALHACLETRCSSSDVLNSLLNMYGKCGNLVLARNIFDCLPDRSIVSWNALIGSYAAHGAGKEALLVFCHIQLEGLKPDEITFVSALEACSVAESLASGKDIHARLSSAGLDGNCFLASSLIRMYGACRSMEEAERVFDGVKCKDVVVWTSLLASYTRNSRGKEALVVYRRMDLEGVEKNRVTFTSILSACAGMEALTIGEEIHAHVCAAGYESDVFVGTGLIDLYGKCNRVDAATKVFAGIHRKDSVCWSVMITAYARNGYSREAVRLYQSMDIPADGLTLVGVLAACSSLGALEAGEHFFETSGFEADEVVGTGLINLYGKCGSMEQALHVFEGIRLKKLITWNSMLAACCTKGSLRDFLELFSLMALDGVMPDEVTFLSVLFACSHVGMLEKGLELFLSAETDYCIRATNKHYICVVDSLGRAGRLAEAEEMLTAVPFQMNDIAWMTLLGACRIHRDLEHGRRAAGFMLELDPASPAPYVVLSNMFATST